MYETSGNLLEVGSHPNNAASPKLPTPGTATSLSENKTIIIDGINPYDIFSGGDNPMDIYDIWTSGEEQRTGYYNYRSDSVKIRVYFRRTDNIAELDFNNNRVDMSLASIDPNEPCNTANGNDCGTIIIKAATVLVGATPVDYEPLDTVDISYTKLTSGADSAHQIIKYNASQTTSSNSGDNDFENLSPAQYNNSFTNGTSITFKALITDLAGNQTETAVHSTALVVDQSAPSPPGTTGDVDTDVDSTSNDISTQNIVSGLSLIHI